MIKATNTNEQVVLDLFSALNSNDMKLAREKFSNDIKWTPMYKGYAGEGVYEGERIFTDFLASVRGIFGEGDPQHAVSTLFSSGDTVVAETHCTGSIPAKERNYDNDYCWIFQISDGKIHNIREYFDSATTIRTLFE